MQHGEVERRDRDCPSVAPRAHERALGRRALAARDQHLAERIPERSPPFGDAIARRAAASASSYLPIVAYARTRSRCAATQSLSLAGTLLSAAIAS